MFTYAFASCFIAWFPGIVPVGFLLAEVRPPKCFWCATQGRLMATESAQSFDSQSSRRLCLSSDWSIILVAICDILHHSYGISFYSELAQKHSIRAYDLAFDLTTGRVYPYLTRHRYTPSLLPNNGTLSFLYKYRTYIHTAVDIMRWDYRTIG